MSEVSDIPSLRSSFALTADTEIAIKTGNIYMIVVSLYLMFSVKDMREYGFERTGCKRISQEDFDKLRKQDCVPKVGDVLVAKDGSYLKHIFV